MVELRKRPPPKEPLVPAPPAKKAAATTLPSTKGKGKAATSEAPPPAPAAAGSTSSAVLAAAAATTIPTARGKRGQAKPQDQPTPAVESAPTAAAPTSEAVPDISEPTQAPKSVTSTSKPSGKFGVGYKISLDGTGPTFGGTVQTNDGANTTLSDLLKKSQEGIVIFTYPKASTPGCTTQACLFRDSYKPISDASYTVYGLSTDSPKSNTTFVTKHSLPYPLLCDPGATLTSAIGMKKPGPGKSTSRGVVVIAKDGTVKLWEQAGPQKTLDVVLDFLKGQGATKGASADPTPSTAPTIKPLSAVPAGLKAMDDGPYGDAPSPYIKNPDTKMMEAPLVHTPSMAEQEAAETALEVSETAKKLDGTPNSHSVA